MPDDLSDERMAEMERILAGVVRRNVDDLLGNTRAVLRHGFREDALKAVREVQRRREEERRG